MKGYGRNGSFEVCHTDVVLTSGGFTAWVEVFSNRHGKHAPIMITGDAEKVQAWAKDIFDRIERLRTEDQVREIERKLKCYE